MVAGDASAWRGRGNTPDLAISLCLLRGRRLAAEVLLVLLLQVALHVEVVLSHATILLSSSVDLLAKGLWSH